MTRLQKTTLMRIKELRDGLHCEIGGGPFISEFIKEEDRKKIEAEHIARLNLHWQEDHKALTEMGRLIEAMLAEPDDDDDQ